MSPTDLAAEWWASNRHRYKFSCTMGPKPIEPTDLAAEWKHLATWWASNRHRYNLAGIARAVGMSKTAAHTLLTDPTTRQYAATAEKLDALRREFARQYLPD